MIERLFQELGFNDSEVKVFVGLAEVGKTTAQLLAKRLGVPRTTVYSTLDSLSKKAIVLSEQKRGTTFYFPNKPEALLRLVEREREALAVKERAAKQLVEAIRPYYKSRLFSVPRLMFFEGRPKVETLLYDYVAEWRQSMSETDMTWWGYQDTSFVVQYREWLEYSWARIQPGEKVKLISNDVEVERELKGKIPGREIRPIPEEFSFTSTIWVVGSYIQLISTKQEPHYAFQIRDPVFAENLRVVFRLMWRLMDEK